MTYTYAVMTVSRHAFEEIKAKLLAADYGHAVHARPDGTVLDMRGIALTPEEGTSPPTRQRMPEREP